MESLSETRLYTWGFGKSGELGSPSPKEYVPYLVQVRKIVDLSTGGSFTICLDKEGKVYSFGKSEHGRNGLLESTCVPTQITNIPRVAKISAGYWHSLLVDEFQLIWSTGYNKHGQLGLGHTITPVAEFTCTQVCAQEISAGGMFSLAISLDNKLLTCGIRVCNTMKQDTCSFEEAKGVDSVVSISAGQQHAFCVSESNLMSWGSNSYGELGLGHKKPVKRPSFVMGEVIAASASKGEKNSHSACIDQFHNLWTWGSGYKDQLGYGTSRSRPAVVEGIQAETVECGGIHTLCTSEGRVYSWGCGSDGRLGHPEAKNYTYLYKESFPKAITELSGVVKVSASYYHNAAIINYEKR